MPRKPINKVLERHGEEPRERIWKFIRERKSGITTSDIRDELKINSKLSFPYLKSLVKAGHLEATPPTRRGGNTVFEFVKGPVYAPRVRPDGSPVKLGAGQENMWRSMKMLGQFTVQELATAATTDDVQVKYDTARCYIQALTKAGYLKKCGSQPVCWYLIPTKNTGPKAPQVQNRRPRRLWDPNLRKIVWPLEEEGGAA